MKVWRRLGEILIERQWLAAEDLARGLEIRKTERRRLGQILRDTGLLSDKAQARALSEQQQIPLVEENDYPTTLDPGLRLEPHFLRRAKMLPLKKENGIFQVVAADPLDLGNAEAIGVALRGPVELLVGAEGTILQAIDRLYGLEEGAQGKAAATDANAKATHLRDLAKEAPVIRLVNQMINEAVELGASDIHLETFDAGVKVRYRIDGVLQDRPTLSLDLQAAVISRVKIMAGLDIAERRLPQDGRIQMRVSGRTVDIRIITTPTFHGEGVVMRLLDKNAQITSLEKLGLPTEPLARFRGQIVKPHGMILVTGPTGSGKSTTLYAALREINTSEKKIITIEDPVEYDLPGVNQIHVKPTIGLTFANGLRSILRQDPNVIMVGEIRDQETAEIAVRAAMTGHLLFSTLHTNDAAGAPPRLIDLGVEPFLLSSSLLAILAQRLVRTVCENCKEIHPIPATLQETLGMMAQVNPTMPAGRGCQLCQQTGYKGRLGIFELLPLTEAIQALIQRKSSGAEIRQQAILEGMLPLQRDGVAKVLTGQTTPEEVLRVTRF